MKIKMNILNFFLISFVLFYLKSCGENTPTFSLERAVTNEKINYLNIDMKEDTSELSIRISGAGFESSIPIGEWAPFQGRIDLSYETTASYSATIQVAETSDTSTIILQGAYEWEYNPDLVPEPLIGVKEEAATNTEQISITFRLNNNDIIDIWTEGDLAESPEGSWEPVPDELFLEKQLSSGDGHKSILVKYRDIHGNIGPEEEINIISKTNAPLSCTGALGLEAIYTNSTEIPILLQSEDSFSFNNETPDTKYRITGEDGTDTGWQVFSNGEQAKIFKIKGILDQTQTFLLEMTDIAGNPCPQNYEFELYYEEEDSRPSTLSINNGAFWTDSKNVILEIWHPELTRKRELEMSIFRGVAEAENTNTWIPYNEDPIAIELSDKTSNLGESKSVWIKFREKGKEEILGYAVKNIFLDPYINIHRESNEILIQISPFHPDSLKYFTINGCEESYEEIAHHYSYPCTPNASEASVIYHFQDDSTLEISAPF